ncbi:Sporulation initiation inhibitor protein Soj [Pseudomonas fluorescens]|uniref:ParA family protein n=1 Tax=unclassified Pseudomonas TaxID=196821 RepID=UPI001241B166|nr:MULTISPECIES: ParA family protein [unclassified Pseudomonas]MDI3251827.1 ParA family protein [Pseudomonas sp. AL10]MDI3267747.1 ParA family protein [Pseudomonas sp. AL15]VVO06380.1 Sporulation initiation inhibitor protein Soj [Pseudomonas fluorescens]VVO72040.1 Sporulation initiation inhibitor protein Soj [Pseudomonas fluorescens]
MRVVSVVSTKGGVGKTTVAANLGGLLADAGLRVLLLDLDSQPTLSSYYALNQGAIAGAYELIALNQTDPAQIISTTVVVGLDLILSNDDQGRLTTLLLHAPDGRLRLRNLLEHFRPRYDLLLIDTQGARSVLLEMAILASDLALSPITPEMLAARELRRGTLKLLSELEPFRHLGITPPPLRLLLNQVNSIRVDTRMIIRGLRETFAGATNISVLDTAIPDRVAYTNAASLGLPVHRVETRRPHKRRSPSALETMQALAIELFPEWHTAISTVSKCAESR